MVIIRGAWRTAVTNVATDPAGLGGVMVVYLKTKHQTLAIANTYWPVKNALERESSNSLQNKYKRWMRSVNMHGEPIDFLRHYIEVRLDKQKSKGHPMILLGDFNAHWDGAGASYSDLPDWANDCCLKNEIAYLSIEHLVNLETYIRGNPSQIDHILTSDDAELVLKGFGCGTGAVWHLYKDHVPIWAEFNIARGGLRPMIGPKEKQPRVHVPLVTPNIYKEEDVIEYNKKMLVLLESLPECADDDQAGELLERICRDSVAIARAVKPPAKKNKFYHDGWSPIFFVLRAQLICMINIRRGL